MPITDLQYLKVVQLIFVAILFLKYRPSLRWVIALSSIPLLSMFVPGAFESGDFVTHTARILNMSNSLKHGIFPVRWEATGNGGYGYPLFMFNWILPFYISSFLHILGLSAITSLKIYLSIAYISSSIFYFNMMRALTKSVNIAAIGTVFYLFAPYHLINLQFRAAAGEMGGLALFPLIGWALVTKRRKLFAAALAMLFLTHPGATLLATPFIVLAIFLKKNVRFFLPSVLLAVGLASFYLIPSLLEAKYTFQAYVSTLPAWTTQNFPRWQELFWSPWRYGFLFQGNKGELAYTVGIFHWIGIFSALYLLLISKRGLIKKYRNIILFSSAIFLVGLLFILPISAPIWNSILVLKKFQFPSRVMLLVVFGSSILSAFAFSRISPKFSRLVMFMVVAWTALNWSHRAYHPEITDRTIAENPPIQSERLPEAIPVYGRGKFIDERRNSEISVVTGTARVTSLEQFPIRHRYNIDVQTEATFRENTAFFPGWRLFANTIEQKITFNDAGIINFSLPPGNYTVSLEFRNTPIRTVSEYISMLSLITLLLWIAATHKKTTRKQVSSVQ